MLKTLKQTLKSRAKRKIKKPTSSLRKLQTTKRILSNGLTKDNKELKE